MSAPWMPGARDCARCGTELAAGALACPSCKAFVHADRLKLLAAKGERLVQDGKLIEARAAWDEALTLMPHDTQQYAAIEAKLNALATRITDAAESAEEAAAAERRALPWHRRWMAGGVAVFVLLLSKGKLILLGLAKLPTLLSMASMLSLYSAIAGWQLALGLIAALYLHELGHVSALLRIGIQPKGLMFVPGIGAFVSYADKIRDPRDEAAVSLAGPIWGAGAGLIAFAIGKWTGHDAWLAVAQVCGVMNLVNLAPVWILDGQGAIKPLDRPQRVGVAAAAILAAVILSLAVGPNRTRFILIAIAGLVLWAAWRQSPGKGDPRATANFIGAFAVLTWLTTVFSGSALAAG